jgi:hypothetical protein
MQYSNGLVAISVTFFNTTAVASDICSAEKKWSQAPHFLASLPSIL